MAAIIPVINLSNVCIPCAGTALLWIIPVTVVFTEVVLFVLLDFHREERKQQFKKLINRLKG